jgi:hypothetical protein
VLHPKEDHDMTAATQSLTGPGTQGNYQQAGFTPAFPAPFGPEHQGFGHQYGLQTPQASQFPQQSQQIVQQLMNQILPIAQQAITAQVLSTVAQQVQQQLPQLIGQYVQMQVQQQLPQFIGQQSGSAHGWQRPDGPWQQPFGGQQYGSPGGLQYGSPWTQQPGLFGQGSRPYAGLS